MKANHSSIETDKLVTYEGDLITMNELEQALGRTKKRKATGQNRLNAELFTHGGILLKLRLLHFHNMCWKR